VRRTFQRLLGAGFVLALAAVLGYSFLPKPVEADVVEVTAGLLRVTVNEDGKTRIRQTYVVSAPVAGELQRIELEPGDSVQAGDVLAVIEPAEPLLLDARTREQAVLRVGQLKEAAAQAATAVERAEVALRNAEIEAQRVRDKGSVATDQELQDALFTLSLRKIDLRTARRAEEIAQYELRNAEAVLRRFPRPVPRPGSNSDSETSPSGASHGPPDPPAGSPSEAIEQFDVRAPIDGKVLRVLRKSAGPVAAAAPLVELGNPLDLEIEIDVLSSDAVKIRPSTRVILEHWGGEQPLEGRVRLVEPSGFTKISALGVEEQRVNVIADFSVESPDQLREWNLGENYRVEARIIIWENPDAVKVPLGALFRRHNEWAVFVAEGDTARLQRVEIGQRNGVEAEVLSGLKVGDRVILHPSDQIADGRKIKPMPRGSAR
jgi:HlyD family secretion protein